MWSQFSRLQGEKKKEWRNYKMDISENRTVLLSVCGEIMRNTESGGDGLTMTEVEECGKVQQSQNIKHNTWLIINGFISVHSDQSAGSCFPLSTLITKPARHYTETSQFPFFTAFFFFFKTLFLKASGGFCVCVLCTMYIFDHYSSVYIHSVTRFTGSF